MDSRVEKALPSTRKLKYIKFVRNLNIFLLIILLFNFVPASWLGIGDKEYKGSGEPSNIGHYISIEGKEEKPSFHLTYVSYYRPHSLMGVFAIELKEHFSKYDMTELPKGESVVPDYMSEKEYATYSKAITEKGFQTPVYLAYKRNGKELKIKEQGLLISYSPLLDLKKKGKLSSKTFLQSGDIILSYDDTLYHSMNDFTKYVQSKKKKDKISLKVLRDDTVLSIEHTLVEIKGITKLGVISEDYRTFYIPTDLTYDKAQLSGPSGGLMFTLYIMDLLNNSDLDKGYKIAGTGTIDSEGNVGQIGGVEYKLQGAIQTDFDIFFVPKDINDTDKNEQTVMSELKRYDTSIQVVPVSTLDEALTYLEKLPKK